MTLSNDAGRDCIATAEEMFTQQHDKLKQSISRDNDKHKNNIATISEWNDFIQELKRRELVEKTRMEARDRARSQANEE